MRAVLSREAVTTRVPSGEKAALRTTSSWPCRTLISLPVVASHIQVTLAQFPEFFHRYVHVVCHFEKHSFLTFRSGCSERSPRRGEHGRLGWRARPMQTGRRGDSAAVLALPSFDKKGGRKDGDPATAETREPVGLGEERDRRSVGH